jgi:hypothetical protein
MPVRVVRDLVRIDPPGLPRKRSGPTELERGRPASSWFGVLLRTARTIHPLATR